eukprot:gene21822-27891_t
MVDPEINVMPYSTSEEILFISQKPIPAGQEIYSNYGEEWFKGRSLVEQNVQIESSDDEEVEVATETLVSLEDLEKYGHCLTDVTIGASKIPLAGKGLFAKKSFLRNEKVVIAPVLTLQRSVVELTVRDSVLMNYCITPPGNITDMTLFPLNNAVLINHASEEKANLKLEWFDWSSIPSQGSYFEHLGGNALDLKAKLTQSPEELFPSRFAQFDIAY